MSEMPFTYQTFPADEVIVITDWQSALFRGDAD